MCVYVNINIIYAYIRVYMFNEKKKRNMGKREKYLQYIYNISFYYIIILIYI